MPIKIPLCLWLSLQAMFKESNPGYPTLYIVIVFCIVPKIALVPPCGVDFLIPCTPANYKLPLQGHYKMFILFHHFQERGAQKPKPLLEGVQCKGSQCAKFMGELLMSQQLCILVCILCCLTISTIDMCFVYDYHPDLIALPPVHSFPRGGKYQ